MADLSTDIETNAQGPKKGVVDGVQVEQHPLGDQIKADEYLAKKTAGARKGMPFRRIRMRPPGMGGE